MSQVTEESVRFETALASIKLIQASAVLDLTEDDFDFLTSNKVWIATDRSRACRCVEACVYGTLFFQAEDGIRDDLVTGVQTCALPISSDRDIRELMGARKLYIADVFDVDSGSRTRKPFGRVFHTQNKSLIFYAFDLDHEPGVKNASAFQVWGERDAESGEKSRATNLGILYMGSESNRRWVLRLDDAKQLAEIDAVFVTVE